MRSNDIIGSIRLPVSMRELCLTALGVLHCVILIW